MRNFIIASLLALASAGATGSEAQTPLDEPATSAPGFDVWGTGEGSYFYHRVIGTCETLTHAHGRNAAWGLWRMPIAAVTFEVSEASKKGDAIVRLTCADATACIAQGALSKTPERVSEHEIPFDTMDRANAYARQVAALKSDCGLSK